jgi:hypothetical protein
MKKRIGLLLFLLPGLLLWKTGAFGFLPLDRTLIFQLPGSYSDIRSVDVQLWHDGELVKREERFFKNGLTQELQWQIPLARGTFRTLVSLNSHPQTLVKEVQLKAEATVVLDFR